MLFEKGGEGEEGNKGRGFMSKGFHFKKRRER
jgi:hypothetical protein